MSPDPAAAIQALVEAYLQAYSAKDAAGCAAVFTADAQVLSSFGPPAAGSAAIAADHQDWFAYGEENKAMTVTEQAVSGDMGWCLVHYTSEVPQPDGSRQHEGGHSLNILALQPDGRYLIRQSCLVHHSDS